MTETAIWYKRRIEYLQEELFLLRHKDMYPVSSKQIQWVLKEIKEARKEMRRQS